MSQAHDPNQHARNLRMALATKQNPPAMFIGAGCPMAIRVPDGPAGTTSPLVPDIAGITIGVIERLKKSEHKDAFERLHSQFDVDGKPNPNVEEILSRIRGLQQVAGKDVIRNLNSNELDLLDKEICEQIVQISNKELPGNQTPYHKLAVWVGATQRTQAVEIFTSNYDLLMEQALEENRVPYFDGFIGAYRTFFDTHAMEADLLPPRWARLWKVHGSINWYEDDRGLVIRGNAEGKVNRRVIHPSHLKYEESRKMPYLAMLDRLQSFFRQASPVLITCGYSFRDDHLNASIVQGLQGNPNAIVFALLYGNLSTYEKAIRLAQSRSNLSLLAPDEAIIGTRRAPWIEKESSAEGLVDSVAVEWVADKVEIKESVAKDAKEAKKPTPSPVKARFKLGDFSQFATFVEEVIGTVQEQGERGNAK